MVKGRSLDAQRIGEKTKLALLKIHMGLTTTTFTHRETDHRPWHWCLSFSSGYGSRGSIPRAPTMAVWRTTNHEGYSGLLLEWDLEAQVWGSTGWSSRMPTWPNFKTTKLEDFRFLIWSCGLRSKIWGKLVHRPWTPLRSIVKTKTSECPQTVHPIIVY